ncbi:hypothetical protein FRC02_006558 [Tulasnella sp. 418]|nr:hypothetical protein FRC02_006558 [Tulasnella sp. 418]
MELSEKAKGKRRAIESLDENPEDAVPSSSTPAVIDMSIPRAVIIRFTEGISDLLISVSKKETVREIKRKIRLERAALSNRRLRLIHSGRLLTDGTFLYDWLDTLEERQKRSKGAAVENTRHGGAESSSISSSTWLHCSVGPEMSGNDEEESVQKTQLTPLRGFDRLVTAGFTEDDIATIRRQFHASRGITEPDPVNDDENEHARALEEQWIDDMDAGAGMDHVDGGKCHVLKSESKITDDLEVVACS